MRDDDTRLERLSQSIEHCDCCGHEEFLADLACYREGSRNVLLCDSCMEGAIEQEWDEWSATHSWWENEVFPRR